MKLIKQNGKNLLIVFGGGDGTIGVEEVGLVELAKELNSDLLLLKDLAQNWFLLGINETTNNVETSVTALVGIVKEYDKVFVTGLSLGGYAAVLYGSLINSTAVVAFSPQTSFDFSFVHPRAMPHTERCLSRVGTSAIDLREHLQNIQYSTRIFLVAGEEHPVDCRWCDRLVGLINVEQVRLPTKRHNLSGYLYETGDFSSFMKSKLLR